MFTFILFLLVTVAAQIFGGAISWLFVKKFYRNLRAILLAEILLMLAISLLLIEEGLKITPFVFWSVLAGIITISLLDKIIPHKHKTDAERVGFLVFISMCFHEFPEGIAFGSSYLIDPNLGAITAILIALHNIPEGSIVSIPYFMKKQFVNGLKLVSITQLLYITGGLISYYLLINFSQQFQALTMAFAAGAMLYIIVEELLWRKIIK